MPNRKQPLDLTFPLGQEYLDQDGRVWRVDKSGQPQPTDQFVYQPKKAPMSAFGPPGPPPAQPPQDPLQRASTWVQTYVPGGWWLVAGVGGVVAWNLLVEPAPKPKPKAKMKVKVKATAKPEPASASR